MSQLINYFAAASDKAAATLLQGGPGDAGVATPDLDPAVVLANLEAILTGVDEDIVVDNPRLADLVDEDGDVTIYTCTDELRDALATASPEELADAAESLVEMEELEGADADDILTLLEPLAELARTAQQARQHLYCWVSL